MTQPNDTTAARITSEILEHSADPTPPLLVAISQQAVLPRKLDEGVYGVLDADGAVQIVETPGYKAKREDDYADAHASEPLTLARAVTTLDVASFVDYLARNTDGSPSGVGAQYAHAPGELEVWADLDTRIIKATLDGLTGWRRHTAALQLKLSREWVEWVSIDGKLLDQVAFAEFIESHLSTIAEPAGAVLLDVCQTLQVNTAAVFKQQNILASGQRVFRFEEATEAKAGQRGDLTIPGELTLVLRPFQGADQVPITARFRYQLREGALRIGIKLAEPEAALEEAFNRIVAEVQGSVPVHVAHGRG